MTTGDYDRHGAAALAKGGRTNFAGFILRLGARLPFLLLAARLYGAGELGRFAYATMVVEFVAAFAVFGLKRGIAAEMAKAGRPEVDSLADCLFSGLLLSATGAAFLLSFPVLLAPAGTIPGSERYLALIVPAITLSDISLAGLAFRHRIDRSVHARSLIEPWVLVLVAIALAFTPLKPDGLLIAYGLSLSLASAASLWYAWHEFGLPRHWQPSLPRSARILWANLPLLGADMIEWSARKLDVFLLGRFAGADIVGIYYVAQQVATLAGKIRVSFDPILAPMVSVAIEKGQYGRAARHIRQAGFWVLSLQIPVVLALAVTSEGVLGLFGPAFASGGLVLVFLLLAELAAVVGSISEMGLIYTKARRNLQIGLSGLALQAALSFVLIPRFAGEGASAALFLSILVAGFTRHFLLHITLREPVFFFRRSLVAASLVAGGCGWATRRLPEFWHMITAIPLVLLLFAAIIWIFGYKAEDRSLFHWKIPPPADDGQPS